MPLLFETGAALLTWPCVLVECNSETQVYFPWGTHSALPAPEEIRILF